MQVSIVKKYLWVIASTYLYLLVSYEKITNLLLMFWNEIIMHFQVRKRNVTTQSQPTPQCEGVHRSQPASQVIIITFICFNKITYVVSSRLISSCTCSGWTQQSYKKLQVWSVSRDNGCYKWDIKKNYKIL